MSLQDKIASKLVREHGEILDNQRKQASGWWTDAQDQANAHEESKYGSAIVAFGKDHAVKVNCKVADSPELQVVGLQGHKGLGPNEGMMFPQEDGPRKVSFHMGSVSFNIDLVYVDGNGRVSKIMNDVEPNTAGVWSHNNVACVIEVNGGFCRENSIEVGTEVCELIEKEAQLKQFNPLNNKFVESPVLVPPPQLKGPTPGQYGYQDNSTPGRVKPGPPVPDQALTDVGLEPTKVTPVRDQDVPWDRGTPTKPIYPPKQAQERFDPSVQRPDWYTRRPIPAPEMGHDRFRDRDLVDQQVKDQPMDPGNYEMQIGYDPSNLHDQDENSEEAVPGIRQSP